MEILTSGSTDRICRWAPMTGQDLILSLGQGSASNIIIRKSCNSPVREAIENLPGIKHFGNWSFMRFRLTVTEFPTPTQFWFLVTARCENRALGSISWWSKEAPINFISSFHTRCKGCFLSVDICRHIYHTECHKPMGSRNVQTHK